MSDSVKDEVKDTCKLVLDNKGNDQVVVTNEVPIISSDKDIKKSFYEEVGEAFVSLDNCDSKSDMSSIDSADINEVKNVFGHLFYNRSNSEEILQFN